MLHKIGKAILYLLLALLVIGFFYPLINPSRDKARQSACMNNLKQLGRAFELYARDWDDCLPNSTLDKRKDGAAINASAWDEQVAGYVKSPGTFKCPGNSLKRYSVHQPFGTQGKAKARTRIVSYGMNDQLLGVPADNQLPADRTVSEARHVKLNDLPNPKATILLAEMGLYDQARKPSLLSETGGLENSAEIHVFYHVLLPLKAGDSDAKLPGVDHSLHEEGANYLYTDGHVKWKRIENTLGRPASEAFNAVNGQYPGNEWMIRNNSSP